MTAWLLALTSCGVWITDAEEAARIDRDGDGYVDHRYPGGTDCNDFDASIHPGAEEACDGVDRDCDGETDDPDAADAPTWYPDADGDGYGDAAAAATACSPPEGAVAEAGDCLDTDPEVHPGALEVCGNALDDDCDGEADEDDAIFSPTWYLDADGDGWGDDATATVACSPPGDGWVELGGDCAPDDPAIHPGAVESCDGVDDNCTGSEADAVDAATWYLDADGDGWGVEGATMAGCEAPEGFAPDPGDCDDAHAEAHPGLPEVCDDGLDNDCDGTDGGCRPAGVLGPADADAVLTGPPGSGAGTAIARPRDVDGDGLADLLVAAPGDGTAPGRAWLVAGPVADGDLEALARAVFEAASPGTGLGERVALADADGNGTADPVLAEPLDGTGGAEAGRVALFYGGAALAGILYPEQADVVLAGDAAGERLGASLAAAGDLDGDLREELLVGLPGWDAGRGAALVFPGGLLGEHGPDAAATFVSGTSAGAGLGEAVAPAGDQVGDPRPDWLAGAPTDPSLGGPGVSWLLDGDLGGGVDTSAADAILGGALPGDLAGAALAGGGDLTGDGQPDLLVGAPGAETAWLLPGPVAGSTSVAADGHALWGPGAGSALGWGDLDGDGTGDAWLGADEAATGGPGRAWLLYGPVTADRDLDGEAPLLLVGELPGDRLGAAAALGDLDGDGIDDWVVGMPGADRVVVVSGHGM